MLKLNNYTNYILKDISFELPYGKNLIILGNNGAGKTTLAKVLSGLIKTEKVTVQNKNLHTLWGKERSKKINYIPTKLEIFDEYLTVKEFLSLSRLQQNISIQNILDRLGILYLKNKSCKSLSSGESQLVLIAGAILQGSDFTIFDEIVSNLDPHRQKDIFTLFKKGDDLHSKIIITHNLDFAYKLGYNIIYIKKGQILFKGTNEDFFDQKHLDILFEKSVKRYENHIVVDL